MCSPRYTFMVGELFLLISRVRVSEGQVSVILSSGLVEG